MSHDDQEIQRFLTGLQQRLRDTNRAIIDPLIPELTLDALEDLIEVGAKVRGAYLWQYFELAERTKSDLPPAEDLQNLRGMRELYEEISAAYRALETAIARGYVTTRESDIGEQRRSA